MRTFFKEPDVGLKNKRRTKAGGAHRHWPGQSLPRGSRRTAPGRLATRHSWDLNLGFFPQNSFERGFCLAQLYPLRFSLVPPLVDSSLSLQLGHFPVLLLLCAASAGERGPPATLLRGSCPQRVRRRLEPRVRRPFTECRLRSPSDCVLTHPFPRPQAEMTDMPKMAGTAHPARLSLGSLRAWLRSRVTLLTPGPHMALTV